MHCCQANVLIRNSDSGSSSSTTTAAAATSSSYSSSSNAVMSSTLVETVSINYEDFSEYFLTCGTCLCSYDGAEHTPKLLPCSHTVCVHCLSRIVASPSPRDDGYFRCPICRDNIRIPSGGVAALPPSFLVNQLLDLMATQRREVIPKCSTHSNQELLFCETCDLVFCTQCTSGSHYSTSVIPAAGGSGSTSHHHTVIPLAVAVKRMSEILCYKANECYSKLNSASEAVTTELHRLEHSVDAAFEEVNRSFEALTELVELRRLEVVAAVEAIRERKRSVLQEQLELVETERSGVEGQCEGLQYQVEVRNITQKISLLNTKIDSLQVLVEPRENCFLKFESSPEAAYSSLCRAVQEYGRVATSRTLPSLCCLEMPTSGGSKPVTHLSTRVFLHTVDYQGHNQVGEHNVSAHIFGRPVKNNPLTVDVCGDHNPHTVYGSKGSGLNQLLQPAAICLDDDTQMLFVADTGNSRIKVLDYSLSEQHHLVGEALAGRSVTGLCVTPAARTLMLVNWRNRTITELTQQGEIVQQFTHQQLQEPTTLTVTLSGLVLVVDSFRILVFSPGGTLAHTWGERGDKDGQLGAVTAICAVNTRGGSNMGDVITGDPSSQAGGADGGGGCAEDGEVVVADHRLQVFTTDGTYCRTVFRPSGVGTGKGPKGTYGGLFMDSNGLLLASRQERTQSCVQIFDYQLGSLIFTIASAESKLKRPAGLAATRDGWLLVLDIANCCIKKFRYR
uniref:Tripartite motif-containing protein 3 n=1 Tax=Hirondellea gigas TaxID=1518452 RepID=A0A6A7G0L1_9CRUS